MAKKKITIEDLKAAFNPQLQDWVDALGLRKRVFKALEEDKGLFSKHVVKEPDREKAKAWLIASRRALIDETVKEIDRRFEVALYGVKAKLDQYPRDLFYRPEELCDKMCQFADLCERYTQTREVWDMPGVLEQVEQMTEEIYGMIHLIRPMANVGAQGA